MFQHLFTKTWHTSEHFPPLIVHVTYTTYTTQQHAVCWGLALIFTSVTVASLIHKWSKYPQHARALFCYLCSGHSHWVWSRPQLIHQLPFVSQRKTGLRRTRAGEQELMSELVTIIEQRNQIVNNMDQDRQRWSPTASYSDPGFTECWCLQLPVI